MNKKCFQKVLSVVVISLFSVFLSVVTLNAQSNDKGTKAYPDALLKGKEYERVKNLSDFSVMADSIKLYVGKSANIRSSVKVESVYTFKKNDSIYITFNRLLADYPFRKHTMERINSIVKKTMPNEYKKKKFALFTNGTKLSALVNPFYSETKNNLKKTRSESKVKPLKSENNRPFDIAHGLKGKHIAMQNSHGWFYEPTLDRWEFQRARLFGVVEDTYTMSYVLPFVVPMLENAGAVVMLPKERDWNPEEVIVDNDTNTEGFMQIDGEKEWKLSEDSLGFANPKATYKFGENPFKMGRYLSTEGIKGEKGASKICWKPTISKAGEYAVYISYHSLAESTDDAKYIVKYSGGTTEFSVNQRIAGGIWVYLGTFAFDEGETDQGVYLSNANTKGIVTADACRFGGGMSNIARGEGEGFTSGMPRFMEGSKYWLQWSGFPDTVYSYSNNVNDYNDDYVSRGKWTNYLAGGSSVLPNWGEGGLKVPVDLSFAFHTDAGNFLGDSIVGTLSIYTRTCTDFGGDNYYPAGGDRIQGRYLADIVQTQLTDDISDKYGFAWTRRQLWDRSYSESRTPQVPGMLLEFLSHHNFADMKFGLDPDFRFTASRAIYKGILKFLAMRDKVGYVVQPLPVDNMRVVLEGSDALISWSEVEDKLEPTAKPTGYTVYTSVNGKGYDRGVYVSEPNYRVSLEKGIVYKFKVTAVNDGGESFPSEVVSVGLSENSNAETVLIVNAFDRVGAPKWFQSNDSTFAGFLADYDHGVPYLKDASYLGKMYEYRRSVKWTDDDAPGFGACYNDMAGKVIAGNTFDYAYDHGIAFMKAGYNFVSSTRSAVESGNTTLTDYKICDIILGKQAQSNDGALTKLIKYAAYTPQLKQAITDFCNAGGKLLISGAYIATDLVDAYEVDPEGAKFAADVLKIKWMTHSASKDGRVAAVNNNFGFNGEFSFYSELNDKKYVCEAPDAFTPVGDKAFTIFRYPQTSISAATAYDGDDYKVVAFGFPIEVLKDQQQINELIGQVIAFLTRQ